MRFAIDSNILVYAVSRGDGRKHEIAAEIMVAAPRFDSILPVQVIGEFLNVVRRMDSDALAPALAQASRWMATIALAETQPAHLLEAAQFATRYKLQFWDSVIWQVAVAAGAAFFLTEDMQDGLSLGGLTVINPFSRANESALRALMARPDS